MSIQSPPINTFSQLNYNPSFFSKTISITPKNLFSTTFMTINTQIYTGSNTYNIGTILLQPGTYLVNIQYAFQGIWSAVGSVTNCGLCINNLNTIATGIATPTFFYCQGPALQTSVTGTTYNFGINGSGIITISSITTLYLMTFCYYTGTAVIQNQTGNLGSASFTLL